MLINGYSGKEGLMEAAEYATELLQKYAMAKNMQVKLVSG
jgi:hypothetical protein